MLSRESYEVLNNFPERLYIKDKQPIHHELLKLGYLRVKYDADRQSYYCLTDPGRAAMEEYERTQREERRGDDAIDIARESNGIAREANRISNKANCKSTVAIVVAVIAILAQLISAFHEELWALVQRLFHC